MLWKTMMVLVAVTLVATKSFAASKDVEKEGKKRLTADLAKAKQEKRPSWVAATPLEITLTADYNEMRGAVDQRFMGGKPKEALRILYELIAKGQGRPRDWAAGYLPQALVWAGEIPFAIAEYEKRGDTFSLVRLARCLLVYDQIKTPLDLLNKALATPPAPGYSKGALAADVRWAMADVYRSEGDYEKARLQYNEARKAFENEAKDSSKPQWYAATQRKHMELIDGMIAVCLGGLGSRKYKDGTYSGKSKGYAGDIFVDLSVKDGKISEVKVERHNENLTSGSLTVIPERITAANSTSVDAVTGATCTSEGIMGAAQSALRKAVDISAIKTGVYTGQAKGYEPEPIVVKVTAQNGRLLSVQIVSENESRALTALTDIPKLIVAKQSIQVDAVTGATITSNGIMGAVGNALLQAR